MTCSTIANFSDGFVKDEKTGKRKYWMPDEFVPDPLKAEDEEQKTEVQSMEEMKLQLMALPRTNRVNKTRKKK